MHIRNLLLALILIGGCDSAQTEQPSLLVVEMFVMSEEELPEITLRRALPLQEVYQPDQSALATGAMVQLAIQEKIIPFSMNSNGKYEPLESVIATSGAELALKVQWENQTIVAQSKIPPPITLDSVQIAVSDNPVAGLLLDSVFIDPFLIDSLGLQALGTGAREGLVYLVEATLFWADSSGGIGNDWWMRTQLLPYLGQERRLRDYFLSPEVLQSEVDIPLISDYQRSWSGAYAVPISGREDKFPNHGLRIGIIRSSQAYADFVTGSSNPSEREPPSNIQGGVGIFAGLAIDTIFVQIQR